jgi:hypothetical protein
MLSQEEVIKTVQSIVKRAREETVKSVQDEIERQTQKTKEPSIKEMMKMEFVHFQIQKELSSKKQEVPCVDCGSYGLYTGKWPRCRRCMKCYLDYQKQEEEWFEFQESFIQMRQRRYNELLQNEVKQIRSIRY